MAKSSKTKETPKVEKAAAKPVENVEEKEHNIKYFGVLYATTGEILLTAPMDSIEACMEYFKTKLTENQNLNKLCKATTVIKRDLSLVANPEFLFGCPKTTNVRFSK